MRKYLVLDDIILFTQSLLQKEERENTGISRDSSMSVRRVSIDSADMLRILFACIQGNQFQMCTLNKSAASRAVSHSDCIQLQLPRNLCPAAHRIANKIPVPFNFSLLKTSFHFSHIALIPISSCSCRFMLHFLEMEA